MNMQKVQPEIKDSSGNTLYQKDIPSSTTSTTSTSTKTPILPPPPPSTSTTTPPSTTATTPPSTTATSTTPPSTTATSTTPPSTTETSTTPPSTTETSTTPPSTPPSTEEKKDSKIQSDITAWFSSILSNKLLFYILTIIPFICLWFFIVYKSYNNGINIMSVMVDLVLLILLVCTVTYFYVSSTLQKEDLFVKMMEWIEKLFDNPNSLFIILIAVLSFYIVIFIIGIPMSSESKPITIRMIESIIWIILLFSFMNEGIKFLFDIKLADICIKQIYNVWNDFHPKAEKLKIDESTIDQEKEDINHDEVFNIANNSYTYQDAQAICKSFDSRLATYDEIEHSYKNGGEWCTYGWSDSQMILFPTQKKTWNELQKSSTDKNSCGRPGVNGGYINNPLQKFGVNCYGKKPNAKKEEEMKLLTKSGPNLPKTKEDHIFEEKVNFWRENADKMITVNSFNSSKWNEI